MERPRLNSAQMSEAIVEQMSGYHREILDEISEAIRVEPIVVVGMAQNPFVKRARKALDAAGLAYRYLEYGSYFSQWKPRLAIKMWSGYPTFPQVYVRGVLIGGAKELQAAIEDGSLAKRLAQAEPSQTESG